MRTPDITEMKSAQYSQMVADRKACTLCLSEDFKNPADPDLREWDSSHIGPWTRWLGDLNARLMVVGQEWGDTNAFKNQHGLDQPRSATNTRLRQLLSSVGIHVPDVSECSGQSGVFLTNAALCLKRGGCQARVRSEWFTTTYTRVGANRVGCVRQPKKILSNLAGRWLEGTTRVLAISKGAIPDPSDG